MYTVFMSYKRGADTERAKVVRAKLEDVQVKVFQDIDMAAGAAVSHILDAQLRSALAVLVLWTRESTKSHWVEGEALRGLDRKVLVTAVFDQIAPSEAARSLQWGAHAGPVGLDRDGRPDKPSRLAQCRRCIGRAAQKAAPGFDGRDRGPRRQGARSAGLPGRPVLRGAFGARGRLPCRVCPPRH